MESCFFSQTGRMHYPHCFLLCNHRTMNKNCTLQKFFAIWFKYFVSQHLLSMHSIVRALEERCNHKVKLLIFLLSSPNLCMTSSLLAKQMISDSKQHQVSWPNFIFPFILFLRVLSYYSVWIQISQLIQKCIQLWEICLSINEKWHHPFTGSSFSFAVDTDIFVNAKDNEERRIFSNGLLCTNYFMLSPTSSSHLASVYTKWEIHAAKPPQTNIGLVWLKRELWFWSQML